MSESELRTFLKAGESNISVTLSLTSATGLTSTLSPAREGDIYSLNGMRVTNPSKGIYIKNEKKIKL